MGTGWATHAVEQLANGETVQVLPRGHSMSGKVNDGDLVTLAPCDPAKLAKDDIVLVKVRGNIYLHLIKAVQDGRFLIGNNLGGTNGGGCERHLRHCDSSGPLTADASASDSVRIP